MAPDQGEEAKSAPSQSGQPPAGALKEQVKQINFKVLRQKNPKEGVHIWEQEFFPSSDEEDNDTDEEEPDTLVNNSEFAKQQQEEVSQILKEAITGAEKSVLSAGKGKALKSLRQQYENIQEMDWQWYDPKDKSTFFTIHTVKAVEKDEEVCTFYGRRSNRYLMINYGFALEGNRYESVSFRMIDYDILRDLKLSTDTVFVDYLTENNLIKQYFEFHNREFSVNVLSKEFRLKQGRLCEELLNHIRVQLIKFDKQF